MADIDRIRERHSPVVAIAVSGEHMCVTCMTYWPCETRIETERADRAEAALDEATRGNGPYILTLREHRDAAEANAERLAEALRMLLRNPNAISVAREALRQHDNHKEQDRGGCDCHLWSSTHTCPVHGHVAALKEQDDD